MSLEGAKFICLDEAGNHGEIVLAKGRKFTMGYYVSCDFVLVDERAKGVHCEIESDAFGRVTIRNLSPDKPILVNGSTVEIKRILLNNSKLSILDKEYLWLFPKISSNEFEDLPLESASTPQKQIGIPEQPPNSCPDFKLHRELPKRFTVHNFAYCIQSDEEGNTSSDENTNEEVTQTKSNQNEPETQQTKEHETTDSKENITQAKDLENRNRSVTPEPKDQKEITTNTLMETPKMNLINCTKDKENKSTQKKNKQLLTMCNQSDVVITSFSPRETGVRIEKSFATIVKPKVLVTKTPATPKSVYSTPKSDLKENDQEEDDERELLTFHTPSTSKKGSTATGMSTASSKVLKNSSMHLIDLTTPNKLRPASPYLKSALKACSKKNIPQTSAAGVVDKTCSKLSSGEQLGLATLPCTPVSGDANNSPLETPSSVISVSSSTDTSSVIEVTSDGSSIGITPGSVTGLNTPVKLQNRTGACTPKRTPQSLMKRALLTSAKKQNTTPQRNTNTATTPRRESINRIPLRSNLALLRTPVTPQASTGERSNSQLPRRQSMSTPTRKSMPARSRFDSSPSTSNLASPSAAASNKMASRRSSINPISAARALPTSTPVSGSSNNSGLRTRAACKTSPLHKVRKSVGGVPLSSHISKARRSIALPASTSKISSIKEKSPQQVMSDRLVSRARKSLCLTPISARSRQMVTAAKTPPPQQSCPSSILKARTAQSARKPERKAVLFADKQPLDAGEVDDLSRTFIIDSDEEDNAESTEKLKKNPKDATFSPEKDTKETENQPQPIEIPVDVEELTDLTKENKETGHEEDIKTSNEDKTTTAGESNAAQETVTVETVPLPVSDKRKSIVTEESFAEIINDSQETNEEKRLTDTIDITDSPKESSQNESQESFADALDEMVEENIKETETEQAKTETQHNNEKSEVLEAGFGEESIVETIESSNGETVLEEAAENLPETISNTENVKETDLEETNQLNEQSLTENQTEEQNNIQEIEKESLEEVVETETNTEELKPLDAPQVENRMKPIVDEQKSHAYKPIVEDITLEGSLIEKETKDNDSNVSKQPLYEDITLEGSLIEEQVKSEEINDEITIEPEVRQILQTAENSEEQTKQDDANIATTLGISNISQEEESSTVQETQNVADATTDKNVAELSETNQAKENLADETIEELQTSTSEVQSSTIFTEGIDDDLDNTNKLLEEIEDVLNKSDEIKQKHLIELEEGKQQESEKPLTEEFESEKLTQEIMENVERTTSTTSKDELEVTEEPKALLKEDNISIKDDKVEEGSDLETPLEDHQCVLVTETSSPEVTSETTENVVEETEKNTLTDETPELSIKKDSATEMKNENENEENVECNEQDIQSAENNVSQPEIDISKDEKPGEIAESVSGISSEDNADEDRRTAKEIEKIALKQTDPVKSVEANAVEHDDNTDDMESKIVEIAEENVEEIKTQESEEELETPSSNQSQDTPSEENIICEPEDETSNAENVEMSNQDKSEAAGSIIETEIIQNEENGEELEATESETKNVDEVAEIADQNDENVMELEAKESENAEDDEALIQSQKQGNISHEAITPNEENTELSTLERSETKKTEVSGQKGANVENQIEDTKPLETLVSQSEDNSTNERKSEKQEIEIVQNVEGQDQPTESSSKTDNQSTTNTEQKATEIVSNQEQMVESEEIIAETEKLKELSLISSIKKKIEIVSNVTPRRNTRRASQSADTPQTTTSELSFTPRRNTRRASQSAETPQSTTAEPSFTPRRSARRASMSAETTSTATPTKRTTRRASLSVVSETPITPKAITKRRSSISIDDETVKPSTSKTPRKQRLVIPEEFDEVTDAVITEEEEVPEEKTNEKKRRSSISEDNATKTVKTPLKQLELSMVIPVAKDEVIIEEEEVPAVDTEENEQTKDVKVIATEEKDSKNSAESKETTNEPEEPAAENSTTQVSETQHTTKENAVQIEKVTISEPEISNSDEKVVAAEEDAIQVSEEEMSEKVMAAAKDHIVSQEKQNTVETMEILEKEVVMENILENEATIAAADNIISQENKELSIIVSDDVSINTHEKSSKPITEKLNESSTQEDEVDKVLAKEDICVVPETTEQQYNVDKSSESHEEKGIVESSETSKAATDRNSPIKSTEEDNTEDEMENLQFVDDAEKTPTKIELPANAKEREISTPVTKKSVKIVADSPKTPLMAGMRDLLKTPKPEVQTPRFGGIRDLVRTPKVRPECEEEEIEKLSVVADLVKTPKATKEIIETATPKAKKQVTIVADSPKTPLMTGIRELLKTPKAEINTPKLVGIRNLVKTPKSKIENEQEETEKLAVVAELVTTPEASKVDEIMAEEMPSGSMKNDNLKGVKELLKTPKSCSTPRFKGMRELMQTPKTSSTPVMSGVKELLDSPVAQENSIVVEQHVSADTKEELPPTTSKNIANLKGVKELLRTPKSCSTPRFKGMRELMQTPKMSSTPIMGGIKELMDSPAQQTDHELEKFLRTPTAKNVMIPSMPSSAIIEKSSDSIEISTEYDLNASHADGETANLGELFKTPVASCFVERITASYYGEEREEEHDEALEKHNKTKNESLQDTLNKAAEEAFDTLVGQETQIQTPIRKIYKRKSFALQTPQAQSPFSAAEVLSDLPKTDVEEWIETLDQAEPPTILEFEDDAEDIVKQDIVSESLKDSAEVSALESTLSEKEKQNVSSNESIIPETCTKVYLSETSLTNVTTASLTTTKTKDPLLSTASKPTEKETRPVTPIESEISGINLLDQSVDSIQDEPSMLDEPLVVEEPSMFEEPLLVSDDESEANNTLNNADVGEASQDEANDLSEPLMLSDSEDLNQSKDSEELEAKPHVNDQEKSMLAKVSDVSVSLAQEDPLEDSLVVVEDSSIVVVEGEDKSLIEDESNVNAKPKEVVEPTADNNVQEKSIIETKTDEQCILIEDSPIKESHKSARSESITEIAKTSELEAEVDAAETNVFENVQELNEHVAESIDTNTDAKEISIEETKVTSKQSDDIFIDTSITESFEETSEKQVETMKESPEAVVKESNQQQLDHECQDIFMDNSNIDESFADEATNEENDVENESAMVEVTTKEVTKDLSEDDTLTVEAVIECVVESEKAIEEESVKENQHVLDKEKEQTEDEHVDEVDVLKHRNSEETNEKENSEVTAEKSSLVFEESQESSQGDNIEDKTELRESSPQTETERNETSINQPESSDQKHAELTSDIADEDSSLVSNELESSQIETTPHETSANQKESSDEKRAEITTEIVDEESSLISTELESSEIENNFEGLTKIETKANASVNQPESSDESSKAEVTADIVDEESSLVSNELESSQIADAAEKSSQIETPVVQPKSSDDKQVEVAADKESSLVCKESESSQIENTVVEPQIATKPSETSVNQPDSGDEKHVEIISDVAELLEEQTKTETSVIQPESPVDKQIETQITEQDFSDMQPIETELRENLEGNQETDAIISHDIIETPEDQAIYTESSTEQEDKLKQSTAAETSEVIDEEAEENLIHDSASILEISTDDRESTEISQPADEMVNEVESIPEEIKTFSIEKEETLEKSTIEIGELESSPVVTEEIVNEVESIPEEIKTFSIEKEETLEKSTIEIKESESSQDITEDIFNEVESIPEEIETSSIEKEETVENSTIEIKDSASSQDITEEIANEVESIPEEIEKSSIGKEETVENSTVEIKESESSEVITEEIVNEVESIPEEIETSSIEKEETVENSTIEIKESESSEVITEEIANEVESIPEEIEKSSIGKEETVENSTVEIKESESSQLITEEIANEVVSIPEENEKSSIEKEETFEKITTEVLEKSDEDAINTSERDQIKKDIPSETELPDTFESKEAPCPSSEEIVPAIAETEENNSEESSKSVEISTDDKDFSTPDVESSNISKEKPQPVEDETIDEGKLNPLAAENDASEPVEDVVATEEETKQTEEDTTKVLEESETCEEKSESITTTQEVCTLEKLPKTNSELTKEIAASSGVVTSYDFEIKINDTDHQNLKESVMDTKSERAAASLRKRKCSQSTETSSNVDSELSTTSRARRNTKTEEDSSEITAQITTSAHETGLEINKTEKVEAPEKSEETVNIAPTKVSEVSEVTEVSSIKTSRRKRTVSESSQDSTQGEESHSRSRRDRRKVIKKPTEEKLTEVKEESVKQPQISKADIVSEDVKPKRKRTTSESSQGSVKDDDNYSSTRRARRKVQKPPSEETVKEQTEECIEPAAEQPKHVAQPEEPEEVLKKQDDVQKLDNAEEIAAKIHNELEQLPSEALIMERDEEIVEISAENRELVISNAIVMDENLDQTFATEKTKQQLDTPASDIVVEVTSSALEKPQTSDIPEVVNVADTPLEEIPTTSPIKQHNEDKTPDVNKETVDENKHRRRKPTVSESDQGTVHADENKSKTDGLPVEVTSSEAANDLQKNESEAKSEFSDEMPIEVIPTEAAADLQKDEPETKSKLSDIIEVTEPEEVTETEQKVEEIVDIALEEPKEQPAKRLRRKHTVSESSQGEDDSTRSRKTRRKVQKTPIEEVAVEESAEVASTNNDDIAIIEDKSDLETKKTEIESEELSVAIEQKNEPTDSKLPDGHVIEVQSATLEEVKEQTSKRGRRKPTVTESTQGSAHEDDSTHNRRVRRKVQKTPAEEIVAEESKEQINSQEHKPDETEEVMEDAKDDIPAHSANLNTETDETLSENTEIKTAVIKKNAADVTSKSTQNFTPDEDPVESIQDVNEGQTSPSKESKEHPQDLSEMVVVIEKEETQEPCTEIHVEHDDTKELGVKRARRKRDIPVKLPEEPTNSRKGRRKVQVSTAEVTAVESNTEHIILLAEAKVMTENKSLEVEDIKSSAVVEEEQTVEEIVVDGAEDKQNEAVTLVEVISTQEIHDKEMNEEIVEDASTKQTSSKEKQEKAENLPEVISAQEKLDNHEQQNDKAPTTQTGNRGKRHNLDVEEVPVENPEDVENTTTIPANDELTTSQTTKRGGRHKAATSEAITSEVSKIRSTSRKGKTPIEQPAPSQPEIIEVNETEVEVGDRPTSAVSTEVSQVLSTNQNLTTPEEHPATSTQPEEQADSVTVVEEITTMAEVPKGRSASRKRKTPVERPTISTLQGEQIESIKEGEEVPSTVEVPKGRLTSRIRKQPMEHPTTITQQEEHVESVEFTKEMPTVAEVPKVRTASRKRKTPVEHPTTLTQQEEDIESVNEVEEIPTVAEKTHTEHPTTSNRQEEQVESVKLVEEIPTVAEVPKGRKAIRNRKTPIGKPTTTQQEIQVDNEKPIESSVEVVGTPRETEIADIVILDDSSDEEKREEKTEDKSVKKGVKRTRTVSETSHASVVGEKPTKRRARHHKSEIEEGHEAVAKTEDLKENPEEKNEEHIEDVPVDKEIVEKSLKSVRRRGAVATQEHHEEEHHEEMSTKSRRRRAKHDESMEQELSENVEEPKQPTEVASLSEVKITEVNLEPEELLNQQHISPQEENQKEVKARKGRRKPTHDEHHQEEHETLAATRKRALVKHIEHDHDESGTSSKRRVGRRNQAAEDHETDGEVPVAVVSAEPIHSESTETKSTRRHVGRKKQDHDELPTEKHDTEEESKHIESSSDTTNKRRHVVRKKPEHDHDEHDKQIPEKHTTNKRRHVGRKKPEHEADAEHDHHDIEIQHQQVEAKKGRSRRKKTDHSEEPEQASTSHSPETKHRGRKRKESHTDTQDLDASNEKDHNDEKSETKELETKQVNPSAEQQTQQQPAATIAGRGRKPSAVEHITAESHEMDDSPGRRARNVPQRRAATAYHNYDETSDSEVATKTKKKTDSPRKSLEASKSSPTATITSAPIINPSPSPSSTASATTARGRTRKPTAKVQKFLEEERAKAETPKKRGLLAAAAVADASTPQRTPARRGRKPSTVDTEVEGTPQASKGRGRGRAVAVHTKEDHSVAPEATSVVEEKEIELHTTPPPAHAPVKGRRGGRKAKINEEEHQNSDEPPAKKSPLELEGEKQDSTPPAETATPPTRVAGRRNAAAAAKARIEEDALAAAAIDPPKRARAKKAPAKVATPVVATTDTDALSSEVEEDKGATKNKNSLQKRDHRLASASTIEGTEDLEDGTETETLDKPANKRGRKAATTATTTDSAAVPVKRSRKAKVVEEVADNETPTSGEPKTTRGRGRGRKNVHFDEHQEAEATTSTPQTTATIEPPAVDTPEPVKKATRTRRK